MWNALLTAALLVPAAQDSPEIPPRADAKTFEALVAHVVPEDKELRWRSIPWRPTLRDGLRDGAAAEKPVLLWAMNGHPLGST